MFEGFLFKKDSSSNAQYTRAYRCYAAYNNAAGGYGTGYGQGYTTSAPYTWWIDCTSEYNKMAGFDFLDYNSDTDCSYSGMVYCTSYRNGQTRRPTGYDAGIYLDGAHDILVYGCTSHESGAGTHADNTQSQQSWNINVTTEHASKPALNKQISPGDKAPLVSFLPAKEYQGLIAVPAPVELLPEVEK